MAKAQNYMVGEDTAQKKRTLGHRTYFLDGGGNSGGEKTNAWRGDTTHNLLMGETNWVRTPHNIKRTR